MILSRFRQSELHMVIAGLSISLDGFVAGPNISLENPLGEGGMQLHEWVFKAKSWREQHGMEGGEEGTIDDDVLREGEGAVGARVMGRHMFSGGRGPWQDDPNANGWWGDDPPFHGPVFVLTHHAREPLTLGDTTFTFVTDGFDAALAAAREAAGDNDVGLSGGGSVVQQALAAGQLDRLELHVIPVLLGSGSRLFGKTAAPLTQERVVASDAVAHLYYRVG